MRQKYPIGSLVLIKESNSLCRIRDHYMNDKYLVNNVKFDHIEYLCSVCTEDELELIDIKEKDMDNYIEVFNRLNPKEEYSMVMASLGSKIDKIESLLRMGIIDEIEAQSLVEMTLDAPKIP